MEAATTRGARGRPPQGHAAGTREVRHLAADVFDITWQKAENAYPPTTMYRDYAISPNEIHWESPTKFLGPARYLDHHGERPVSFRWRLDFALPTDFFETARVVSA